MNGPSKQFQMNLVQGVAEKVPIFNGYISASKALI